MSNLVKYKVDKSLVQFNQRIVEKYQHEMPKVDMMLFDNILKPKICELESKEAADKLRTTVTMLHRDLGISNTDNINVIRIMDMINKYFGFLTVPEIRFAFELLILGKLDRYFPRKDGIADTEAYNNLSPKYFVKVINSYRKYKNSITSKYHVEQKALSYITEDMLNIYKKKRIIEQFEYCEKTGTVNILMPRIMFESLKEFGAEIKCQKFTYKDYKLVYNKKLMSNFASKSVKDELKHDKHYCKVSKALHNDIDNLIYSKSIKVYFLNLINSSIHIKTIING